MQSGDVEGNRIIVPEKKVYQWANKKQRAIRYMNGDFDKIFFNQEIAFASAKVFCKETNIFMFSFIATRYPLDIDNIKDDNGNVVSYHGEEPQAYYGVNFTFNNLGKSEFFQVVFEAETKGFLVINEKDFKDKSLMEVTVQYLVYAYLDIQFIALRKKEKIQKIRALLQSKSSNCSNENRVYKVNLNDHVIYEYEPSNVHREFTRHCEAWSVRGHYRQYKSGKTIFIKPYIKGKGRLSQKQYVM